MNIDKVCELVNDFNLSSFDYISVDISDSVDTIIVFKENDNVVRINISLYDRIKKAKRSLIVIE